MAYGYFVERGCVDGYELDDWLRAEAQIEQSHGDEVPGTAIAAVEH